MAPMRHATDRSRSIGAAASVAFMSLSIAGAIALIDLSKPAQSGVPANPVLPAGSLEAVDLPAVVAAQPDPGRTEPAAPGGAAAVAPASVAAVPRPAPPMPSPTVRPTPKPAPVRAAAERPARPGAPVEHGSAAQAQSRAEPRTAPAPPPRVAQRREPPPPGMITPSSLRLLAAALNLTAAQRTLYQPLERALLAVSVEQAALARAGQDPKDAFSLGTVMSMYGVAQPFLNALREDQKARVRAEARSMGFGFAAAQI